MIKQGIGVVGSTTIDTIVTADMSFRKLGGVTTYAGITYSRHAIPTFVVSNVAKGDMSILDILQTENIFVSNGQTDHTTCFVNLIKGDKCLQKLPQTAKPIEFSQILEIAAKVDGLHLGPLHPLDIDSQALNLLGELNKFIIVDVQGYTRQIENQTVYPLVTARLSDALRIARFAKASGDELKSVLAFYQTGLGELMQRFKIEEFLITLGSNGGFVRQQNGKEFRYQAAKIDATDDPTGAGDVFLAAYTVGRFLRNETIPGACRYAAKISARQVEGKYIARNVLSL